MMKIKQIFSFIRMVGVLLAVQLAWAQPLDRIVPISITEPSALVITLDEQKNPKAFGRTDGHITVVITGGTTNPNGSYTVQWKDGSGTVRSITQATFSGTEYTSTLQNVGAGTYTVTVTDGKNCQANTSYTITQPPELKVTIEQLDSQKIKCNGETGSLTAKPEGGVPGPGYTYKWYRIEGTTETLLTETQETINDLPSGIYRVKLKDVYDEVSANFNLTQPSKLDFTATKTDVSCYEGSDGTIDIKVIGGTAPYTFEWLVYHGMNPITSEDRTALSEGTYYLTITDFNQCEIDNYSAGIEISQPSAPLSLDSSTTRNPTGYGLANGSIAISVSGGTAPYNYAWTNTGVSTVIATSAMADNLPAGNYTVTVTDANGCQLFQNYELTQPDRLITTIVQPLFNLCFNDAMATIQANTEGGVSPYFYQWYNLDKPTEIIGTNSNLEHIKAGSYRVVITDINNNTTNQEITTYQPDELIITTQVTDVLCFGEQTGSVAVNVTGGTIPYSYQWNNGAITEDIDGLKAGDYTLTVTDTNLCTTTHSNTIIQPPLYDVNNVSIKRPSGSKSDGNITIEMTGGVLPFSYQWLDSSGRTVQETFNSNSRINILVDVLPETYTILITDALGCLHKETYNLSNPGELIIDVVQTKGVSCYGTSTASLKANSVGGVGGNRYAWYNAVTNAVVGSDSELLINIPVGTY